jgi:predicted short-subunit dehydrogenase-like oxidoreductase (DUF2520 family)
VVDVAVVGAGRVGTAVAVLLRDAGHRITAVAGRAQTSARAARYLPGVPLVAAGVAAKAGELVLLGVPDDAIVATALELSSGGAFRKDAWVAHLSGAAGLEPVSHVRDAGARPLALHLLQTFPDVESALARIPGSALAVTADDDAGYSFAEALAKDLRVEPFRLADEDRPLYHAAAVVASNYVVASAGLAEELFIAAGVPDAMAAMGPLLEATVGNILRLGPGEALTGPAARGDAGTVAKNLQALSRVSPHAVLAYVAMAKVALELATRHGRLPAERRALVEEVLGRWT